MAANNIHHKEHTEREDQEAGGTAFKINSLVFLVLFVVSSLSTSETS